MDLCTAVNKSDSEDANDVEMEIVGQGENNRSGGGDTKPEEREKNGRERSPTKKKSRWEKEDTTNKQNGKDDGGLANRYDHLHINLYAFFWIKIMDFPD